nr:anti-sigma factor [Acidobacteriota bacterium]
SPPALTARVESLERAVARSGADAPQSIRGWRPQYTVLALLAASLAGIVLYGLWMQRRVDTRLNEATVRISEAERQRDETVTATRQEAARNVADARQSANQAQTVSFVLAAPDRLRYWLGGIGPYSRAYGQVMVSRSRGVVFSASRLPAAGDGRTYQLWLRTRGGPVSAGVFVPDSAGRVTFVSDATLVLPGRLGGALVTLESGSGATRPSESKVLIRTD